MKKFLIFLFCLLFGPAIYADVACPDPQNLKSLQFSVVNAVGFEHFLYWQLLSNKFDAHNHHWNLLFAISTSDKIDQSQVRKVSAAFFYQNKIVLQTQTYKDQYVICRYVVKDTNTRIIAVHPPMKFIFSNNSKRLTSPYFPDPFLEDSWPVGKQHHNENPVKNIQGEWKHASLNTSIRIKNGQYIFCNEFNNCATGTFRKGVIVVPAWKVQGQVIQLPQNQTISWSNNTIWQRK